MRNRIRLKALILLYQYNIIKKTRVGAEINNTILKKLPVYSIIYILCYVILRATTIINSV